MKIGLILLCMLWALSIETRAEDPKELTPKDSSAQQLLVSTSKDHQATQAAWETARQQAQASYDNDKKNLLSEAQRQEQALVTRLRADKHYKDDVAKIDALQKQLEGLDAAYTKKFGDAQAPTVQKIATDSVEIQAYEKTVRAENKWPDSARWDEKLGKWFDK